MTDLRHVAVIDIGKTNAKLALVDVRRMAETGVRKVPNTVLRDGPYPHYDVAALWDFILESLAALNRETPVDAISITTHGATAALVDAEGGLALPILDYEHDGPDAAAADYVRVRPPFAETGSPRLPVGLNLGVQLFWQQQAFPEAFANVAAILTYPQYWAFRLTGRRANEASSLGCHTDLWAPRKGDFSSLVDAEGWRGLMAGLERADTVLGPVLPDLARATGLSPETPVFCGIHDSNASLLAHLRTQEPPFSVVSTGTWVVVMAVGGETVQLDETRDTLINVNAFGEPVPSARFMGGREFEMEIGSAAAIPGLADVEWVLAEGIMLLPAVSPGSGPFPHGEARWIGPSRPDPAERHVAVSFYLALMTATCLGLIGADGPVVVEGPFAANTAYLDMLAEATGAPVLAGAESTTGTSIGAALLATSDLEGSATGLQRHTPGLGASARAYAEAWQRETRSG